MVELSFLVGSLKIIIAPCIIICLLRGNQWLAVLFIISFALADVLDGRLAPKHRGRRLFDNASDKVLLHLIVAFSCFHYGIIYCYFPLVFQDILLIAGGAGLLKKGIIVFPSLFHKLVQFYLMVAGISLLLFGDEVGSFMLLSYYILSYTGIVIYIKEHLK